MANTSSHNEGLEAVGPYVFVRVQESKGASGPVHTIELLANVLGTPTLSISGVTDPSVVGACTLLMALETEKVSGRMVIDSKIETLSQDTGDPILDIQMLATLLRYVQKYCLGRDIKHLSLITMAEHPAWLTSFFTFAGFSPCKCLKSDDLEKGQRVCLKLDKSGQAPAKAVQSTSKPEINGDKANHTAIVPKPASKPPKLTMKGAAPAKALDEDDAAKWLSQNQQILSPTSASTLPEFPNSDPAQKLIKSTKQSPKIGNGVASELPPSGDKRKRSETCLREHDGDDVERRVRRREENGAREPTKQKMREEEERLHLRLQKEREALQRATDKASVRTAGSMPPAPKTNSQIEERSKRSGDMTDALLAQTSKLSPVTSSASIKKEAAKQPSPPNPHLTPAVRGSSPDTGFWRSNAPAKSLTCFYWATHGYCLKDERDCLHAHYHTGDVARPPPSYKYKAYKNGYYAPRMNFDGADEEYDPRHPGQGFKSKHGRFSGDADHGQDQGMSIRGLDNGPKSVKEEKGAPTQPKLYQDMKLRPGENPYDSYRPVN